MRRLVVVSASLVALASFGACARSATTTDGDDAAAPPFGSGPGSTDASIAARASRVLTTCAGGPESACHGLSAGGMHLPDTPPNLVDVPSTERPDMARVKPFFPDESYLFLKVLGDGGIDGARMPQGSDPLDAISLEALRAWIEAGAPPE